jgi:hypothetical protein
MKEEEIVLPDKSVVRILSITHRVDQHRNVYLGD